MIEHESLGEDVGRYAPALLFVTDARGKVKYVNERWTELLGVPVSNLLGSNWMSCVHADDIDGLVRDFGVSVATGEAYRGQFRMCHSDGAFRWLEVRAEPQRDAGGAVARWFGAGTDIDAQHRAMDALQLLAESGATATSANDVTAVLEGVARAALAGLADIAFFDLIEPDGEGRRVVVAAPDVPPAAVATTMAFPMTKFGQPHPIARAMTEAHAVHLAHVDEAYIRSAIDDPARREAWRTVGIRSMVVAPMLVAGRRLGALSMLRTLTHRPFETSDVRVVEEIARRAAVAVENIRLREAARLESSTRERQFRAIADSMPMLMWTTRADGAADWHNQRWNDYTGQAEGASGDGDWKLFHPQDVEPSRSAWMAAAQSGTAFEIEHRLRRADGTYRWFLTRAIPERDPHGAIVRWYGTNTDVDDARRAQRTQLIFSELGRVLSASLEVQSTLDAVADVVVGELADWVVITLNDEAGEQRIAADRHRDESRRAAVDPGAGLVVPLIVGGVPRGTLSAGTYEREQRLSPADVDVVRELARRIAPAIANAELFERERRVARSFQEAALPATLPLIAACTFSAIYDAGRAEAMIGGDWYDAFALADGRIVLSIGDVAGSGLQAAVTMANMRQAIRGVAYVHPDPVLMLEAADLALRSESPDRFVTAFVAVIDPIEDTISYTTAGHPPPWLCTPDGAIVELEASGLPLGLRENDGAASASRTIDPGSTLVLYTDGLIESTHDIEVGYRRLEQTLREPGALEAPNLAAHLRDAVLIEGSRDDVAILCAHYLGTTVERHVVDVRRASESATFSVLVVAELERCGYSDGAILDGEIVLAELIGNLVRHAPGPATFVIEHHGGRVVLHALDDGPGYRFLSRLPSDTLSERGRGLFLIASLAEAFHVTLRPFGGSHACLTFSKLSADAGPQTRWSKTSARPRSLG